MIYDVQKASFLKRISAFMLDFILLIILATGSAWLLSVIVDYDSHVQIYNGKKTFYEEKYSTDDFTVDFSISESDYNELSQEKIDVINQAYSDFQQDEEVIKEYNLMISLMMTITSIGILVSYAILEFVLPIILKNGQTVGKKVFGIAVIYTNGVRLKNLGLFARTILGKYTLETMIPLCMAIMIYFGAWGLGGTALLLIYFVVQIVILCVSKNNSCIHDLISGTVAVDLASQMIFDTEEQLIEYKKQQHAKMVEKTPYK